MKRPPRLLGILLFTAAAALTLFALISSGLFFLGRQQLVAARTELREKDEPLRLTELAPSPVPDAENFFASPAGKNLAAGEDSPLSDPPTDAEIADFQKLFPGLAGQDFSRRRELIAADILGASGQDDPDAAAAALLLLEPIAPTLAEITAQLARPGARAPIAYEQGLSAPLPHLDPLLRLGRMLELRATAELRLRDAPAAAASALTLLRLANTIAAEPLLISTLARASLVGRALTVIADGLRRHAWTAETLTDFERALASIDLIPGAARALRGERAGFVQAAEATGRVPAGDEAFYLRERQRQIETLEAAARAGLPPELAPARSPGRSPAEQAMAATGPALLEIARTQDRVSATRLAGALERAFLRDGAYPESLDALVPAFLPAVPRDVVSLRPFHYERPAPNAFRLWSEGWNRRNDGGTPGNDDRLSGDWVWNVSPPPR